MKDRGGRGAVFTIVTMVFVATVAVLPSSASAFTMLTTYQRHQILDHAGVIGPDGKRIDDAACIGGRLSTVDPRWAAAFLTNTRTCVRRYGGASGEAELFKRSSDNSVDWRMVGHIGDSCIHHEAGASDRVLRDLGCGLFQSPPRQVRHCSNAGTPTEWFLADITTRHVACRAARRFIFSLHRARPRFKAEVTHFRAYTCTPSEEGVAVWVRCVNGERKMIRWLNGT
ncbi:MAG: hypothetical protein JSS68_14265 [Actinobacteria bacterium]|nr:hypothetical protein [Actinomycetota bacterium]MBS1883725.1 hypothetical protein [Actinomycetota bacterium]